MTALCGGGTSGPKFGQAAIVSYSSGLLAEVLLAANSEWLTFVIPLLGLSELVLSTFCSSDPPAQPTFTAAEANALLKLTLGADFDSGLAKAKDAALHAIWYDACQCTSGALTPVTGTPQPAGSITVVYPRGEPTNAQCGTIGTSQQDPVTAPGVNSGSFAESQFPGMQLFRVHAVRTPVGTGPHTDATLTIFWGVGGTPTFNQTIAQIPPDGVERTYDLVFPQGYDTVNQIGLNATANSTDTWGAWADILCGVAGVPQQPCCPPDTGTSAILNTLLDLVKSMQRNYAPFAYTTGTAHAGLTGSGSISVSRLLGVRVTITTIPPNAPVLPGNPPYIWDLGWMSASETNGMIQERRVSQQQFTWFPQMMPLADQLNYDLFPGVVATFTELVPEP